MIFVAYQLLFPARTAAKGISSTAHSAYFSSALVLSVLWFLYPIAWVSSLFSIYDIRDGMLITIPCITFAGSGRRWQLHHLGLRDDLLWSS